MLAAQVLQSVVYWRYKQRRTIVITSNRVVLDWSKYLDATILEQLMHRCHMLDFEDKIYLLKEVVAHIATTP